MDKKYFETRKGKQRIKLIILLLNELTINATYKPDIKLTTEKKYFETKLGSLADVGC